MIFLPRGRQLIIPDLNCLSCAEFRRLVHFASEGIQSYMLIPFYGAFPGMGEPEFSKHTDNKTAGNR
jgi:hypothetical protein